jgi:hypothetical protein
VHHSDVINLGLSVEAAPSSLLTVSGDSKTVKGEKFGYLTGILYLAPHKAAGFNVCAKATAGCIAACLNTAGQGSYSTTQIARVRKTKWLRKDRAGFMLQLERNILALIRKANREGLTPVVRLNGTSDLPWENFRATFANRFHGTIFERFSDVQFYDYTKIAARFAKSLPDNYDLTFSAADGNENDVEFALSHGGRVAVVLRNSVRPNARAKNWNLPDSYNGHTLVDGDNSDLRFLDPKGCWIGLKAKGHAWKDTTGFVHSIDPA